MAVILLMQNTAAHLNLFFLQRGWLCLCVSAVYWLLFNFKCSFLHYFHKQLSS